MIPYQEPPSHPLERAGEFDFLRKFTGNYYWVLGWISVASTIISIATVYWTDNLHIDFSFLLWFWLGTGLKNGNPVARKWAIAVFLFVGAFLVFGFFVPGMKVNFGDYELDKSHPAFFAIGSLILVTFAVPGLLLLGRQGRAAFVRKGEQAALST